MRYLIPRIRFLSLTAVSILAALIVACGDSDVTPPTTSTDKIQFTAAQVKSLDSTGQVIVAANPGNPDLKSLLDSTLLVFTAGIEAKHIDVSTNLTTAPLYLVGIHRAFNRAGGSSSTWTLVALDDPAKLVNLIEVSGFAQNNTNAAPTTVTGSIGTGFVNAMFLQVGSAGAVTQWHAGAGTVTFTSDAPGAVCPGFTPTAIVTCAMETMHVQFNVNATGGSGGAAARQASVATVVDVPTMRLTYTLP